MDFDYYSIHYHWHFIMAVSWLHLLLKLGDSIQISSSLFVLVATYTMRAVSHHLCQS